MPTRARVSRIAGQAETPGWRLGEGWCRANPPFLVAGAFDAVGKRQLPTLEEPGAKGIPQAYVRFGRCGKQHAALFEAGRHVSLP